MSPQSLNITQEAQILEVLLKSTASSVVPLMLLESFIAGSLCAFVPLGTYFLWVKMSSFPRTHFISVLWIILVTIILHWAFSLRQLESTISGRSLELSVSLSDLDRALVNLSGPGNGEYEYYEAIYSSYSAYGEAWDVYFPLVTETVLFGLSSTLFVISATASFRHHRSQRRLACFTLVIPIMALFMYALSLAHWIISLQFFTAKTNFANPRPDGTSVEVFDRWFSTLDTLQVSLLTLFSFNVVMSDSIVLWRMCVVWDRAWAVLALSTFFFLAILGLNLANIVELAGFDGFNFWFFDSLNRNDDEIVATYGKVTVGIGAAFVSLASNLSATVLVWIRIWSRRRQFLRHPRTVVERFLELLVDSGVFYSVIWLLYCISFFRPVTTQVPLSSSLRITAVSHLDAAMAQITSIYPLIIFILVALDKFHHSRGPQLLRNDQSRKERDQAVTVTFEIDVERSVVQSPGSALPMVHQHSDEDLSAKDETKFLGL
ncbi:hypothetical protein PENSPDRAFT_653789 [Peniophora sp. CONT]|nr:hypothetical protein PENSPDRAFT_653789 [Peniophora sp. CONT]